MPTKLTIDIQHASPAIEAAISQAASATLIKKWVRAAIGHSGLLTLRFVNTAEGQKLNFAFRRRTMLQMSSLFRMRFLKIVCLQTLFFAYLSFKKKQKNRRNL